MITVYVWAGRYGHSAIKIDNDNGTEPSTYISFHPASEKKIPGIGELTIGVTPDCVDGYETDQKRMWISQKGISKGAETDKLKPADFVIKLKGLNEEFINNVINDIGICVDNADTEKRASYTYQLLRRNCSNVVAICLAAGMFPGTATPKRRQIVKALNKYYKEIRVVESRPMGQFERPVYHGRYIDDQYKPNLRSLTVWGAGIAAAGTLTGGGLLLLGSPIGGVFLLGAAALGTPMMVLDWAQYSILKWDPFWVANLAYHIEYLLEKQP